ncbi:MAG: hypothetical protein Q7T70_07255 [Polaromonas sp.]|nr:hypothetical protein [Polaromonas sp.]
MRNAISKLFGRKAAAPPMARTAPQAVPLRAARHAPDTDLDNPLTIDDNSDNATRRQLVQMMLRDGLRKHGIPMGWVECRLLVVNSRSRGPGLYVRLVMRHWDMLLLTYAHAFQQQLLEAITQFEPKAAEWLHGISWELDVGDTCPYLDMPDPSIWTETSAPSDRPAGTAAPAAVAPAIAMPKAATPAADVSLLTDPVKPAKPVPEKSAASEDEAEVMRDLERMFAIRDAHLGQQAFADTAPAAMDFQNTEPAARPG